MLGVMGEDEQVVQIRRELSQLQREMQGLRILALRVSSVFAVALIAVGSFLPLWHDDYEGEPRTFRMIWVGFQAFRDASGDQSAVPLGIGFTGLLLVLLLLCFILLSSVVGLRGTGRGASVRKTVSVLVAVGTVIAALLSLVAEGSDEADVSGGPGAYVVLVGVVLGVAVMSYRPGHALWVDATSRVNPFRGS